MMNINESIGHSSKGSGPCNECNKCIYLLGPFVVVKVIFGKSVVVYMERKLCKGGINI